MTDPGFEFTAAARLDLLFIWTHLAEEASSDVADQVIADIESGVRRLVKQPGIGHSRPDLSKRKLLFYLVHSYFVVYRPQMAPLHVIRVVHASRNVKQILSKN